jgi:WD40 repeat protein
MARVFLSHSSRDNASAGRMKAWLEQQGFEAPFLDFDRDDGIAPGADWEKTLYHEIKRSQAMLILRSDNWSASKWCDREFTCARFLGKSIFQVIETADGNPERPESPAPELQVLDLRQEREAGLKQLKKRLAEIALTAQGGFPWDGTRPPYPGLPAFEKEDAAIYFGRDDDIRDLIERLTARRTLGGARLLVLLGASGSGKSSLLRAGVLPRLGRSGQGWLVVPPFRPQSQPCQELARALALAAGRGADWRDLHRLLLEGDRLGTLPAVLQEIAGDLRMRAKLNEAQILLSIDQGEELFGALVPEEVQRFFRILSAALCGDLPFLAVMTLRSEFLGRLQAAEKDRLTARFEEVSLAPMAMAQIPAIIKDPAQVVGLEVDDAFVQQAAADAETEDALPLLAFALRELYERFGGDRHLSLADYQALGDTQAKSSPLENAVRRRADEVLKGMDPSEQQMKALRDAFVPAMVRFEQGNYVRRPARWDALPPEAQPLLEQLVNARLLISRQEEGHRLLEVAHEALLRKWPRLRGWLDQDREFLIGSQQLEQDLQDWQKAGEQERQAALLSGLKLQRAKAWLNERPQQLGDELRDFVQASIDKAEEQKRQAEEQKRIERRNRRRWMTALSGVAALAVAGGGIAWWREGAARAAQIDQYEANHRALLTSNPLESVLNGLAVVDTLRSNPGAAIQLSYTLEQAVLNNLERHAITTGQGRVLSLVALPNGELVSGGDDSTLKRWGKDGKLMATISTGQGAVHSLVALPNGELVSAGFDDIIKRWGQDDKLMGSITTGKGQVLTLVALPNGELASTGRDIGNNTTIKRWGKNGKPMATITTGQRRVDSLVALPNGELVSAGDAGTIKRWGKDGKLMGTITTDQRRVDSLVALPNGELASGGFDGSIKRWGKDGKPMATIPTGQGRVLSLVALPNGELASAGGDMNSDSNTTIKRWGKDGKQIGRTITTVQGHVFSLVALPNGELASGGSDGSVKRWGQDGKPVATITTDQRSVNSLVELPYGELASAGDDGSVKRWDKDGKQIGRTIPTDQGAVYTLAALPNGELASGGRNSSIKRWGKDGNPMGTITTGQGMVFSLVALPNGELASGGSDGSIKRWGKYGKQIGRTITSDQGQVLKLVVLPNGELASVGDDGSVKRWDKDGTPMPTITTTTRQGNVISLVTLPNGELLTGGGDSFLKRWSKDGKQIGRTITTGQGQVWSLVALPNGWPASGGSDGSVNIWGKDGKPMGTIATGQGMVLSLVALPNGELGSSGKDGSVKRWSVEAVAKRGCHDLQDHRVLRNPQTPPQRAARETCRRLGVLQ